MKQLTIIIGILFSSWNCYSQEPLSLPDTLSVLLDEIKVTGVIQKDIASDMKMAVSVDEYLSSSHEISFIKRGAYAWEPLLNNMSTERSIITIDGMHIFGACTDKMDPVTSYMESSNLSQVEIKSGQKGSLHGATVAGSINLKRKNTFFNRANKWGGSYQAGFESNNNQFFNHGNISYSSEKIAADGGISYRHAGNYIDGNKDEVLHSQFTKFNTSLALAYKTGPLSSIKVDAIFDRANDIGYPALPMDVLLSRAIITSAAYKQLFNGGLVRLWEAKFYFNTAEHYMDDTHRPENLVHMDMPGWSTTYGFLSKANVKKGNYSAEIQLNAHNNLSIAEMRMYPQDRSRQTMFAYSWPWVTTRYAGIGINNVIDINDRNQFHFGGNFGVHSNYSKYSEFNRIFYPNAPDEKTRFLPALLASYHWENKYLHFSLGTGYGQRAPSVSEGYGYYIYNSFDRYDYIGNPNLKNETSYEVNAGVGFQKDKIGVTFQANYFHIQNYIVGKILGLGSPMNYQSVGVKGYSSLDYAKLFNAVLKANYTILDDLHWQGALTYARATDNQGVNLPFIRPLSYNSSIHYNFGQFGLQTLVEGDFAQYNYSPLYGEQKASPYLIWNISADYTFSVKNLNAVLQIGAENLLNRHYSTYADWGNIPRMGRNIFTSLKIEL